MLQVLGKRMQKWTWKTKEEYMCIETKNPLPDTKRYKILSTNATYVLTLRQ